ncbi:uncharacterized protein LOC133626453 isoform X1 [Colius striatus]|uniref:uncharacterized protein LOC133626453 isoform X1 n=1 Tax=Colius striatus TaxID=57412 RepID=UPI002B1D95DC|nr:uncharacterized protein LOC133626453 isoform X1 [Colius striatus]
MLWLSLEQSCCNKGGRVAQCWGWCHEVCFSWLRETGQWEFVRTKGVLQRQLVSERAAGGCPKVRGESCVKQSDRHTVSAACPESGGDRNQETRSSLSPKKPKISLFLVSNLFGSMDFILSAVLCQHHLWLLHPHAPVSLLALPARVRNTLEICSCHTAQDSLEFGTCRNRRCAMNSLQQEHVKAQAASRGAQLTVSQRVRAGAHPEMHVIGALTSSRRVFFSMPLRG